MQPATAIQPTPTPVSTEPATKAVAEPAIEPAAKPTDTAVVALPVTPIDIIPALTAGGSSSCSSIGLFIVP